MTLYACGFTGLQTFSFAHLVHTYDNQYDIYMYMMSFIAASCNCFICHPHLSLSVCFSRCLSASVCRRLSSVAILVARSWVSDANHFGWADKAPLVVGESQVLGQMKSYLTQKSPINVGHVPSSVVVFGEELRMISFLSSSSSALSLSLSGFLPSASAVNAILFVESFSCSCIRATYSPGDTPERL